MATFPPPRKRYKIFAKNKQITSMRLHKVSFTEYIIYWEIIL